MDCFFFPELFGKRKVGISRFRLTYLDGLFFYKEEGRGHGQGRGPPRPKFSRTNLLKSKRDEHFRGVKRMQTPCVNEAAACI